jgi:hypothetical protein
MAIYKDIDISFTNNIYNDVSILTDKTSIINTFKNNIFLDPDELYFNNNDFTSLGQALHKNFSPVIEEFIEEAIENAVQKDDRILELVNLEYREDKKNYFLYVDITVKLDLIVNQDADNTIDFTLVIKRS